MMEKNLVFNIQHYSLHDGPGIRTIVFLKGCPMRCRWCCNPESQKYNAELMYTEDRCIGCECGLCEKICPKKAVRIKDKAEFDLPLCGDCTKCANICPSKAVKRQGKEYTAGQLIDIVERDSVFFGHGEGGLTVSGGEPLTHGVFLTKILAEAKKRRISTAIETCGYADYENLFSAAKYLDYILFDIKSMNDEKHIEFTGKSNKIILDNFSRLCRDYPNLPKKVRTPVVPGFNADKADIRAIREFVSGYKNVSYEPLKYHSFGAGKYKALGREYPMGDIKLSEEEFKNLTSPGEIV